MKRKSHAFIAAWYADLARLKAIKSEDAPHLTASLQKRRTPR